MQRSPFGKTADGRPVERITLENGALSVSILTLGATLQDARLNGQDRPLTLGSGRVEEYAEGGAFQYFGAIVGPVANRIGKARAPLDGRVLTLEANGAGGHALHGGATGLHQKLWKVETAEAGRLLLSTTAPDGEGGYPGNRRFEAEFTLDGAALVLALRAETDAPTLVNLANHSYWNLGGTADFHGHLLQIDAESYLPADDTVLVTGEIRPVAETAMDFRTPRVLTAADAIDHNFCLSRARGALRDVASLTAPDGTRLTIATTEPGLQIFDARQAGRAGLAIEAQFWPDAPNHADFPSVRLEPGDNWEQVTRFSFVRA